MDDEQTTTSVPTDDTQADESQDQPQPEPSTEDTEAGSQEPADSGTTDESQAPAPEGEETEDNADDSEEIKKWAESKGLPLDDPVKLAKIYREAEKKLHQTTQQTSELRKATQEGIQDINPDYDDPTEARLAVLESDNAVNLFYLNNPDAKALDEQMARVSEREAAKLEQAGMTKINARRYLMQNLDTIFNLAKLEAQGSQEEELRDKIRREERELLKKKQTLKTPTSSATTRESKSKVTDDDIAKMTPAEYAQFKQDNPDFNPFQA